MKRRAFLAALPTVVLAGCATRLGLADRVEITQKSLRLHARDEDDPIDAAVRRFDPDDGPYYEEIHDSLEGTIEEGSPLEFSESAADRLSVEYELVEFRVHTCNPDNSDDCDQTTFVREDFNDVEAGDIVDIVSRSSGAGLVSVHESYENRL